MTRKFMAISAAAVAAGLSLGAGVARADTPTTEQLMQKIDQLQLKVDQLEAKQAEAVSPKDVDATVERVLKDAEERSQLLQMEGFTAGYTKGRFTIQDAAGNWVLRPMFLLDFRYSSNYRQDGKHGDELDNQHGYEVSNMKFGFDGVACEKFNYFFLWNTSPDGGGVSLEQAWVDYKWTDDFAVKSGQFVNPVFHEQSVAAEYQLAVDRSVTNFLVTAANQALTPQSFSVVYDPKNSPFNVEVGIKDGFNSANTDFTQVSANCGAFARVNWFVNGPRSEYNDFTAHGNKSDLLVIGGGLDYTNFGDISAWRHTVDVQWENTSGLSVYAAYLGNYIDDGNVDDKQYNWGLLVQAGYMINNDWEAFGRAGYVGLDHNLLSPANEDNQYCEFTVGVNWYLCNHNVKLTVDAVILPGGAAFDIPALNVLENGNTEVVFRSQMQLLL